ncbi:hypothetical protein [Lentzea sp. NPDC092896]|uniref:hypothetical protein n=1 Tax=Lentzea sp. NPDC092896 TaxID=3364127 RepID=UPI00380CCAF1
MAYALFAFGAFLAARMAVAMVARPAYATPLTSTEPVPAGGAKNQAGFADWTIEHGYADATGRRLSSTTTTGSTVDGRARTARTARPTYDAVDERQAAGAVDSACR